MSSLQDQLLKAGIVDAKKVKKVKHEQRKKTRQQPKGSVQVNETQEQAKQALADKAAQDRELNKQVKEQSDKKAIQAQVIQLIKMNAIKRSKGEVSYQFSDGKKIKKLYVTDKLQEELSNGLLAIAKLGEGYELVPSVVAEKIQQRDESVIVLLNVKAEVDEDDPYADYQVPDDLMW